MTELYKDIITTITYYDSLNYAMTSFEVWKYLVSRNVERVTHNEEEKKYSLSDVIKELESEEIRKNIDQYRGYYFLKGRRELVEKRLENNKIAEIKLKRTKNIVRWLRFVPFVRMIAVTGTLAMKNSAKKSDLDLLVVLKHGHIFTGRTLVTLVVHFLGRRRYGQKITDRICLNFFVTDQSLATDLEKIFAGENRTNLEAVNHFCASEHFFILPLFDLGIFQKFQKENGWIERYFPNFQPENVSNLKMLEDNFGVRAIREFGELMLSFSFIEKVLKKWQRERIARDPRTHLPGSLVKASDDYLIFLPEPQGLTIPQDFIK